VALEGSIIAVIRFGEPRRNDDTLATMMTSRRRTAESRGGQPHAIDLVLMMVPFDIRSVVGK